MTVTAAVPPNPRMLMAISRLNEVESVAQCVTRASLVLEKSGLAGKVIVVGNGSTNGTADLRRAAGALVVEEPWAGLRQRLPRGARRPRRLTS